MEDLMNVHKNEIESPNTDDIEIQSGKVLKIKSSTPDIDFKGIINRIFQYVDIADVVGKIEKGAEYVVQIPAEFQGGFKTGEYWIMENQKNGNLWPTLMKFGDDGRNKIVTPLSIKKEEFFQDSPVKDITTNFHNIYMQQKMNEIAGLLEETIDAVRRVEQGQKDDRIGLLEAGRQGIMLALNQKDEESRKTAILLARNNINEAQNKIFKTYERKVLEFKPLPSSTIGLYLREVFSSQSYLDKRDDDYTEIQDYYHLYIESTKMLAGSYAIVDDMETAQRVFNIGIHKLENLNYSNLRTIEYAHKGADFEKIYNSSAEYLANEKNIFLEELQKFDCLSISINGNDLLEALSNGKENSKQEIE